MSGERWLWGDGWFQQSGSAMAGAARIGRMRLAIPFVLALSLFASPVAASVSEGARKWRAGDWAGAVAQWSAPAARGDADAMFNMGQAYRLGRGVEQNLTAAQDYYRRAADKGHLAATANLGITLFRDGRRIEALPYLRRAADQGDLRAAYVLGVATFSGDGAPRNATLGYAYMILARNGGVPQADQQAARMATLLTAAERARGEAAAAALAAGEPVPVELVGSAAPVPRPVTPAPAAPRPVEVADGSAARPVSRPNPAPAPVREPAASDPRAKEEPAEAEAENQQAASGFRVQLGAYTNEQAARTAWATLVSQSADLLKGQKPVYSPRARLVRLQVGPFANRDEARDLCAKLSAAGRPCFVTSN